MYNFKCIPKHFCKLRKNIKILFLFQGLPQLHLALIYEEGFIKDLPLQSRTKNISMPQIQKTFSNPVNMLMFNYHIYGAFYNGKLVLISSSPDKNVFNFYPDENRIDVIPDSNIVNFHVPFSKTKGLQIGDWFWIYGGNEDSLNKRSEMSTNSKIVLFFSEK